MLSDCFGLIPLAWFVLTPLVGVALIIAGAVLGEIPLGYGITMPQGHAIFIGAGMIIMPSTTIIVNVRKTR